MHRRAIHAPGLLAILAAAGLAGARSPEPTEVGTAAPWGVSTAYEGLPTDEPFIDVAAGWDHTVVLEPDGSIEVYGLDAHAGGTNISEKPEGDGFVAVAAGQFHSLALRDDGTAVAWGGGEIWRQRLPAAAV